LEDNVKKTGETIQIVKTVLAMKLQSEQKLVGVAVPVVLFCDNGFLGYSFFIVTSSTVHTILR